MNKLFAFGIITAGILSSCCKFDDSAIWDKLNEYENRIAYLEEVCKKMNSDLVNIQTLVTALESNDYIVNISPLATGDGYILVFKSGKSLVIYHGKDGKDATIPTISIQKDVDGIYYWTIDNEWLLVNGEKVRASVADGKNGQDGITPRFKIEDGDWYVSYDNEASWLKLGKATNESPTLIVNISFDNDYVYIELIDGTILIMKRVPVTLDNENGESSLEGALSGEFSVSSSKKVRFAKGNLQYQASTKTWRFADDQLTLIGQSNDNASETFHGWIDLFAYGSNGNNGTSPWIYTDYNIGGNISETENDWGMNVISNAEATNGQWRTLTKSEWDYIMFERNNASARYGAAVVNSVRGIVFLPDIWISPTGINLLIDHSDNRDFADNTFSIDEWNKLEEAGAVFLPIGGYVNSNGEYVAAKKSDAYAGYWTSTYNSSSQAYILYVRYGKTAGGWYKPSVDIYSTDCKRGYNVRLVKDVL